MDLIEGLMWDLDLNFMQPTENSLIFVEAILNPCILPYFTCARRNFLDKFMTPKAFQSCAKPASFTHPSIISSG